MSDTEVIPTESSDLVVVGSSAGGVEALSILVSKLPADFPAPIVLAQHLDPNRPSSLGAILQRRTSLPVEVVSDMTELQPGRVYVIPANRHVTIINGQINLEEETDGRPRPSIDLLLSTAAESCGEHLIAVILTGTGSDGAIGAVEVKNAGGTVIVQNPQTARYPAMPLALPPTIVDYAVDIEQMGKLLYDLLTGANIIQPLDSPIEAVLQTILDMVNRQVNLDFRPYKTSTILRRIGRRMAVTHQQTMEDYAGYLESHAEELGELVSAFLINVTQFFRELEAFNYLREEILPRLIMQGRQNDMTLRFWSAGCASGEEPYSLAMLITDMLGAELSDWSIKIFATDLDEAAIVFARRGLYTENLLKGLPPEYRERFFERAEHGYRISKTLRQMVIFGQQDLSRSAPFPRIDLVLCRNVLIYFTAELQDYVLNQFAFSLAPDGYLFLGKAETVRPTQLYYEMINKQWKIYRCIGDNITLQRRQLPTENARSHALARITNQRQMRTVSKVTSDLEEVEPIIELSQLRRFNELLLRFLPIGLAVIDRGYRMLTVNGAARRLLSLRDVSTEQDFLHAVRGIPYSEVRATIDKVFRERTTLTLPEIELESSKGGNGRFLALSMSLMQLESGLPELVAISVTDVTDQVQIRLQLEASQAEQGQLMNELSQANRRLNDMNKELMDSNEELQVANEELVLTHEELQASIEEFETTNEELQATNEELETNNEELQATNEELQTTNDELRARTVELQELSTALESESVRLAEIVELAPFYIMVLRGPKLLIEAYNPRYLRVLQGRQLQNRPLEEVFDSSWQGGQTVVDLAHEAYRNNVTRTTSQLVTYREEGYEQQLETHLVFTIVPSHDANKQVMGVIIYAAETTMGDGD